MSSSRPPSAPTSSAPARRSPRSRRRLIAAIAALTVAVAAVVLAFTLDGGSSSSRTAGGDAPAPRDSALLALARRDADDPLALGRADAPVVMIEYADFQCPFCGLFARETQPELIRRYVDKGILRIEWRNFPVFGQESEQAARAAWAAGRQKRFWQFHEQGYGKPRERNRGEFAQDKLVAMARAAGVGDLDRFLEDMRSDQAGAAVQRDREEGYRLGVVSTPAFLINDKPILGAQSAATFRQAIEDAAKAARGE
ncbi:DsbA family protein [Streptomyces palmae]|uniref:DsbA family protein n=1 Tax=Streptomyces palmae TaxID=1701085 RepID=A0A4Z0H8N2_9ACTN|nr:DsbA family protein [Streptomyces palmae]TGB13111.1 DsbA family protein [Streptomyces palmae]